MCLVQGRMQKPVRSCVILCDLPLRLTGRPPLAPLGAPLAVLLSAAREQGQIRSEDLRKEALSAQYGSKVSNRAGDTEAE